MVRPEDRDFMLNHINVDKVQALSNGLEDSYWYGDDDEKVFNELVRKAKALDEIKDYLSRPSPIDEDRYEIQKMIDKYDKEADQ